VISAIYTKWGWVSAKALHRFKEAHKAAKAKGQDRFTLDGYPWMVNFIGYLIEYCEMEGMIAEKTDEAVPLFTQEGGSA
jgi:hypothetical protein